jgi:hypothetical protein
MRQATSGYGTKRTRWGRLTMSGPEGKTDVPREPGYLRNGASHFRFRHKADLCVVMINVRCCTFQQEGDCHERR